MIKSEFYKMMEKLCPNDLAESWDNCGIQINTEKDKVNRVLTALEITDSVIDEAVSKGCDVIVTHHPMTRSGMISVDYNNFMGRLYIRLITAGISVYSCHTSFDKIDGGNNDYLAHLLGLDNVGRFAKDNEFCRRGYLPLPLIPEEIVEILEKKLGVDSRYFRFIGEPDSKLLKVGICTGGGADFIQDAFEEGCDLFITGDVKYHFAQAAKAMGIAVLDAGHFATEKIFAENMTDKINQKNCIEVIASEIDINPYLW